MDKKHPQYNDYNNRREVVEGSRGEGRGGGRDGGEKGREKEWWGCHCRTSDFRFLHTTHLRMILYILKV